MRGKRGGAVKFAQGSSQAWRKVLCLGWRHLLVMVGELSGNDMFDSMAGGDGVRDGASVEYEQHVGLRIFQEAAHAIPLEPD